MVTFLALLLLQRPDAKSIRKQIQARYEDFSRGMRNQDPKILADLMTPDFTSDTPEGGKIGRDQAVKNFISVMRMAENPKWSRRVVKLELKGADAIAIVDGHYSAMIPGRDRKPHQLSLTTLVEDTWVHSSSKWRARKSHLLTMTMKMDGKTVQVH